MDRFARILLLHRILSAARRPVPRRVLEERLECSRATVNRAIMHLRDDLGAPLVYDPAANGYHYQGEDDWQFELPGFWLNSGEVESLLSVHTLLEGLDNGLLAEVVEPFKARLKSILQREQLGAGELTKRVRILPIATRTVPVRVFHTVAEALVRRRRLRIVYRARGYDEETTRDLSPQRLIHYRYNWYLDAWCHLRRGLRSFALERIGSATAVNNAAKEIPESELDRHFEAGYGIFAGPIRATAILRFSAGHARWVADEQWHPEQQGAMLPDGRFELRFPYSQTPELILDIMRYGPGVEVIGPPALRAEVAQKLQEAAAQYDKSRLTE